MKKKATPVARANAGAARPLGSGVWNVQMLGGFSLRNGDVVEPPLSSKPVVCLLARLALEPQRAHAREELADLLWPQLAGQPALDPKVLANRLRHALSTLKTRLEPRGQVSAPVVLATRQHIRTVPERLQSDVREFEALAAQALFDPQATLAARALYLGELMPGYHDDWVRDRRNQLADLYDSLPAPGALAIPRRAAGRRAEASPLRPTVLRTPPHPDRLAQPPLRRLPTYQNTFVGRSDELRRITQAMKQGRIRLLGLVGAGGAGKSRLSVQWAQQAVGFDSVVFVPLQGCSAPSEFVNHLRAAMDLRGSGEKASDQLDQIAERLRGHRALLILDCCEHLLPNTAAPTSAPQGGAAGTLLAQAHALLQRLPGLSLLLTSRKSLGAGTAQITLKPLPLASPGASPEQAAQVDSVVLFIARARAKRGDLNLHARNVASVIELCARLGGLPVFIEIAASRVRSFSPAKLCQALASSLAELKLSDAAAKRAGHHASGHALLQWSWQLLTPPVQAMWAAVATFRSGWTLAAAADVAQCTLAQASQRLQLLVDHSLVQLEQGPHAQARWQMLDVVRDLVQSWLPADQARVYRDRLRDHLLAWAQSLQARHAAFEMAECANVELALETALSDNEPAAAASLCLALQWPWVAVGPTERTVQLLDQLGKLVPADEAAAFHSLRVRLLMHRGQAAQALGAGELALRCAGHDPDARADALLALASARWRSEVEVELALDHAREALQLAALAGDAATQARAAMVLGAITLRHMNDPIAARKLFLQARAGFVKLGDAAAALSVESGLIISLLLQEEYSSAIARATRTLSKARALGQVELQLLMFNRLSLCHEGLAAARQPAAQRRQRFGEVLRVNQQQLKLARQHALLYHQASAVWNQCHPLVQLKQTEKGLRLMGFIERLWCERFGAINAEGQAEMQTLRALGEKALGAELVARCWREGAALSDTDGFDLAST